MSQQRRPSPGRSQARGRLEETGGGPVAPPAPMAVPARALASRVLRPLLGGVVVLHGLVHLLGAVAAFAWADVPALAGVAGPADGALWLAAGAAMVFTGVVLLLGWRSWWLAGAAAVLFSQVAVLTDWTEARAGTVANALLLVAVLHGWSAEGRRGMRSRYRRGVAGVLPEHPTDAADSPMLTEADLLGLPPQISTYLHRTGSIGNPRVAWVRVAMHGRIRASAGGPWMTFTGEQVNTYAPQVSRRFLLDASMAGLPVDVLHVMESGTATMRAAVCSVVTVAKGDGPKMDRSETVTVFNDLCFLAPAALVDAPVTWEPVDEHRVLGTYSLGTQVVRAELVFDEDGDLVDFISDDRLRAGPANGYVAQRWSTPLAGYRAVHGRRLATVGSARWHAPEPEGVFAYIEMMIDDLVTGPQPSSGSPPSAAAEARGQR